VEQIVHLIQALIFTAPFIPLLVGLKELSLEPVEAVRAPWEPETAQEPNRVKLPRFASIERPDYMSSFQEVGEQIFAQKSSASRKQNFHWLIHNDFKCLSSINGP